MKLKKYIDEKVKVQGSIIPQEREYFMMQYRIDFDIYSAGDHKSAKKAVEKYLKSIKPKGKDKVINIEFEYSEERP